MTTMVSRPEANHSLQVSDPVSLCVCLRSSSGGAEEGDREAEANLPPAEPEERRVVPDARRGPDPQRQGPDRQRGDRGARALPALVMRPETIHVRPVRSL